MLQLEDAQQRILAAIERLPSESIPLRVAAGRSLATAVQSETDLPVFDNSAMDGYAVRAEDIVSASADRPAELRLIGQVAAGEIFTEAVAAGICVRIFTGSPIPPGADAVVMQEDTRSLPERPGVVSVLDPVKRGENVRVRGLDVRSGDVLARPGARLTAARLSLLASAGVTEVEVARQPLVGLLATGSELREAGSPLGPGQIYESNRLGLAALLPSIGAVPRVYPLVADRLAETRAALEQALTECDALITTGGVSVGEMDFVKTAFAELGGDLTFWKVAVKPGKPFVFGRWRGKPLFGLPGNPVSALVTFLLLVRPALLRAQGCAEVLLAGHPGVLAEPLRNPGDRRHFMSVVVDREGNIRLAGAQASHLIRALAEADGLVDVPPQTTLPSGSTVRVLRWEA